MNPEDLLQHFERLSEAPDAIPRLRRFILDLAVRGKLVEQDDKDEPASDLLARIREEKTRLGKEERTRKEKTGSLPTADKLPFRIPAGWRWSQVAEIGLIGPRNDTGGTTIASFVPMTLIPAEYGIPHKHEVRRWSEFKTGYTHFAEGDVGLAKITPCFENGKSTVFRGLTGGLGAGTTELHIVRPLLIDADYVLIFLKCPFFIESGIPGMTGTAGQKRVPADYFAYSPFPLPPLPEQRRIVAKVAELMALCDQLEAARIEEEQSCDGLVAACLQGMTQPVIDGEAFRANAHFTLNHFRRVTTRPAHIKQLREAILNLAARGKLVPQDRNDEPAAELLKRIQAEKLQLVKDGLIARSKAGMGTSRLTFQLPSNWLAIRLHDVCNFVTSGSRGWAEHYADSGPKFVRAQNIRFGRLRLDDLACVNPPMNSEGKRTQLAKSDILVVITGAGVTNPALMDRDLGEAYVSQHVALVRPTTPALSRWLLLCLMSGPGGRDELVERAYGAGKPGLNLDNIRTLSSPLPPLAEQHRIVAKMDELMALCDQLEAQLSITASDSRDLLEAMVHEILRPTAVEAA
jgi:type I restriction enzyme, S subunit